MENPFEHLHQRLDQVEQQLYRISSNLKTLNKIHSDTRSPRMTRKQITEEYQISYGTVHNLMKKGKLPFEKVGRKTLFKRTEVERLFQKSEQ